MPLTKVLNLLLGKYFNDFLGSQTHRHKQFSVNFNSAYTHMCTVVTNIVWLHLSMYTLYLNNHFHKHQPLDTATQLTQGKPLDNSVYEVVYGITWLTHKCSHTRHVLPYTARPTGVVNNYPIWCPLPSVSPWVTWVTNAPVCSSDETMEGHWAHAEHNLHNSRLDDSNSFLAVNHIRSNLRGQNHLHVYTTLVCCN